MEIIDLELKTLFATHKFSDSEKNVARDTPSNDSDHLCQI